MARLLLVAALAVASAAAAAADPAPLARPRHAARARRHAGTASGASPSSSSSSPSSPLLSYLESGYTRLPSADPSNDAASIVAWRPPSPWYDANESLIKAAFPSCQHPHWCDAPHNDTAAVQSALHAFHNPPDCDAARFLVLTGEWPSGLGSTLHIHAYTLALAVSDNRVVVLDPDMGWPFAASRTLCGCDVVGKPCGGGGGDVSTTSSSSTVSTNMDCLFVPLSRCPLPPNWRSAPHWRLGAADRVMQAASVSEVDGISQCEATVQARAGPLAAYADRPPSFWHANLVAYIARPRPSTLARIVAPAMSNAFWESGGVPPRPLAAVFMRAGDKGSEAALVPAAKYFAELQPVAAKLNVSSVYLSSDDGAAIHGAIDAFCAPTAARSSPTAARSSFCRPHFIDWHRPTGGVTFDQLMSWAGTWRMDQLVRLAVADLFITSMADVTVGTLSSNWCRSSDALRRAAGRGRVPYVTPERTLYYSVCENVEDGAREHGKHVADAPVMTARLRAATEASGRGGEGKEG